MLDVKDILEGIWHDELFDEENYHKSFNPKKYGKTRIAFLVHDQISNENHEILANKGSEQWNMFLTRFKETDDDELTKKQDKRREESKKLADEETQRRNTAVDLFDAKLQAFEIEEIKNSKNKKLRSKLRKSKSVVEVYALSTIIMMESFNGDNE